MTFNELLPSLILINQNLLVYDIILDLFTDY